MVKQRLVHLCTFIMVLIGSMHNRWEIVIITLQILSVETECINITKACLRHSTRVWVGQIAQILGYHHNFVVRFIGFDTDGIFMVVSEFIDLSSTVSIVLDPICSWIQCLPGSSKLITIINLIIPKFNFTFLNFSVTHSLKFMSHHVLF